MCELDGFTCNKIMNAFYKEFSCNGTEAASLAANAIKVIYRGVFKDNPAKVVVIVQAEEGVIPQHIQENSATFSTDGALMETEIAMSYVAG